MKITQLKGLIFLGSGLSIVGLLFIFLHMRMGNAVASYWLMNQGEADMEEYYLRIKGYMNAFLVSGSIFASIGILLLICCYYLALKAQNERQITDE